MTHKYAIKTKVAIGEFTKEELEKEDALGSDNAVYISIMGRPLNGESMSIMTIPISKKEFNAQELFEVLNQAYIGLRDQKEDLDSWQIDILNMVLQKTREHKLTPEQLKKVTENEK